MRGFFFILSVVLLATNSRLAEAQTEATLDEKWSIGEPLLESGADLSLLLDWETSNYIDDANVDIEVLDAATCTNSLDFTENTTDVVGGAPLWGPQTIAGTGDAQNANGLGSRTYQLEVNINPESIEDYPGIFQYEGTSSEKATIQFCTKFSLSTGGTLVNWLETLVTIYVDLQDGFELVELDAIPNDRLVVVENLTYGVEGSFCTGNPPVDVGPDEIPLLQQGGLLQVCVRPDANATAAGIGMRRIDSFTWIRTDPITGGVVEQESISGGTTANALTELFCPTNDLCYFRTIIRADFFLLSIPAPTAMPSDAPSSAPTPTPVDPCCEGTNACTGVASSGGQAAIVGRSCLGDNACYQLSKEAGGVAYIGEDSCVDGDESCSGLGGEDYFGSTDDVWVGNGSCRMEKACFEAKNVEIGRMSCAGFHACRAASRFGSGSRIGIGSCLGYEACMNVAAGGNDAMNLWGTGSIVVIGNNACRAPRGCAEVGMLGGRVTIGDYSCQGDEACYQIGKTAGSSSWSASVSPITIEIGIGSCNCNSCCKCLIDGDVVPDNSCNTLAPWECCYGLNGAFRSTTFFSGTATAPTLSAVQSIPTDQGFCFDNTGSRRASELDSSPEEDLFMDGFGGAEPQDSFLDQYEARESAEAVRRLQAPMTIGGVGVATLKFSRRRTSENLRYLQEEDGADDDLGGNSFDVSGILQPFEPMDFSAAGPSSRWVLQWLAGLLLVAGICR